MARGLGHSSSRHTLFAAFRGVVPLALGVAPFGLVVGATAAEESLSLFETTGFSVFVFAGAAQLAAIDLVGDGAPILVAVVTALVINSRLLMYSASLAPHFADLSRPTRFGLAYLLVDQVFALAITRFERPDGHRHRVAFYLGTVVPLWALWQTTTVVGFLLGSKVPEDVPVEFAVPLVFIAVLVPTLTDRPRVIAALTAGAVAVAAQGLPANLALPAGAVSGIAAGTFAEGRWGR